MDGEINVVFGALNIAIGVVSIAITCATWRIFRRRHQPWMNFSKFLKDLDVEGNSNVLIYSRKFDFIAFFAELALSYNRDWTWTKVALRFSS